VDADKKIFLTAKSKKVVMSKLILSSFFYFFDFFDFGALSELSLVDWSVATPQ
jgi:hypothetical protein